MELVLIYQETVKDIKKQFNSLYPYLKLEFFTEPHVAGQGSPYRKMVPQSTQLGEIEGILREGTLAASPTTPVRELELTFQQQFGLPVQVFRKQNEVWIETTSTDHLTLAEQNQMAREAHEVIPRVVEEPIDEE